jgi:branched-chain amino acid transport system substrate-binding protein
MALVCQTLMRSLVFEVWILALFVCWPLAVAHPLFAAERANGIPAPPPPFFHLRESKLGYHGPSDDFTDLSEIRLGWFGPTNLNDPLTGDLWWAANLAIREANERGGCVWNSKLETRNSERRSLPFRLIPRWAVDPWGTGVSQLTRMVYDEQPLALLGSVDSASTHLAEQVVAKANLSLVSPIATDQSITLAGVSWMYSCAPSDAAIARVLLNAVLSEWKSPGDRCVLLATTDHESRMTAREVVHEVTRRGRRLDFRFDLPPGAADTTRQLKAAAEAKPAVVIIIAGAEDSARLLRAVREQLGQVPVIGSQSMGRSRFLDLVGGATGGVSFPQLFAPNCADPTTVRFLDQFTQARRHAPDYAAAFTYDATRLLVEAIRRAGPNRAHIREALAQMSPWPGLAGPIHFDGTGQNVRTNIGMGTFCGGAMVPMPAPPLSHPTARNTLQP